MRKAWAEVVRAANMEDLELGVCEGWTWTIVGHLDVDVDVVSSMAARVPVQTSTTSKLCLHPPCHVFAHPSLMRLSLRHW
jgi:hypothetical protein